MYEGIDKKYVEEIRQLKDERKTPKRAFYIKSTIKRTIVSTTKGQLFTLAVLIVLLVFFLKNESLPTILTVLGVTLGFTFFVLMFRRVIFDEPYDPQALPTEPDPIRNKFFSVFYGRRDN